MQLPLRLLRVIVLLSCCHLSARADLVEFTHIDTSTNFAGLPGGAAGHVMTLRFSDTGTGAANRSLDSSEFLGGTLTSGSYSADFGQITGANFVTDGSGALTATGFNGLFNGVDNVGGAAEARIFNIFSIVYRVEASNGDSLSVSPPAWQAGGIHTGWSFAVSAVPEPASAMLIAIGLGFTCCRHRRRNKKLNFQSQAQDNQL